MAAVASWTGVIVSGIGELPWGQPVLGEIELG